MIFVDIIYITQWFCKRTVETLISCASWSKPSIFADDIETFLSLALSILTNLYKGSLFLHRPVRPRLT